MSNEVSLILPTKCCKRCKERKPHEEFSSDKRNIDGLQSKCKECKRDEARERRATQNGAKAESETKRRYNLRHKYGMTISEFEEMVQLQEGKCKICEREATLVIDHCHETGEIRGLLCSTCNSGLGMLKDDPELVAKALAYLRCEKFGTS